jgi:hypothetical protein
MHAKCFSKFQAIVIPFQLSSAARPGRSTQSARLEEVKARATCEEWEMRSVTLKIEAKEFPQMEISYIFAWNPMLAA